MSVDTRAVSWPTLVPEEPIEAGPLAVYPLFNPVAAPAEPGYVLLEPALKADLIEVTEVSEGGRVPTIALINNGALPILALQGQELVGAKQNRTLNVSFLAPHGRTEIPVTCVERGRWGYRGERFGAGTVEHHNLRAMKAEMVYAAAKRAPKRKRGYDVDQIAVWNEVDRESARHDVRSATSALNEVYAAPMIASRMHQFDAVNDLPEGTVGVAVAIGGELVAAEFMESPEAFASVWPILRKSYALSALNRKEKAAPARMQAQTFASWPGGSVPEIGEAVGLGEDVRWEGRGFLAAGLVHEGRIVHGALFARAGENGA